MVGGVDGGCVAWNLAILIHRSPKVMLFAIDLHEDFIDVEGVAVSTMPPLQSSSVHSAEFDAPKADCFATDGNTPLSQKIFNISMAEIESIVEPYSVADDIWRESVTFVCIHPSILSISGSLLVTTVCMYSFTESSNFGRITC